MGLDGAAAAFVLCTATNTSMLLAYTAARDWRRRHRKDATWKGFSLDALRGWWLYLSLAIPALGAIAAEWLAYEVVIFMAGARWGASWGWGKRGGRRGRCPRERWWSVHGGRGWLCNQPRCVLA